MKLKLALLIFITIQFSCKNNSEKQVINLNNRNEKTLSQKIETNLFAFEKFEISKGTLGEIKIGMNINDAEKLLKILTKNEAKAYDFGFDGGGKAYIYSLENEPILALIPNFDAQEIIAIVALSENLKTNTGLNPKSKVKEIQKIYPKIKIEQDLMMGWEFMFEEKNNWNFVFMTEENNSIGEYKEIEIPVKPIRTETKMDWITIK